MVDIEVLKTIQATDLYKWALVNGIDMARYDELQAMWREANNIYEGTIEVNTDTTE